MHSRLDAPLWRHDAYTLRRLQSALKHCLEKMVSGQILRREQSMVVDLGAGEAPYRALFEPYCHAYLACDLEAGPGVDLVFKEGEPLELEEGCADCVVSFQVLEHVWDIDAYLAECRRLLAPDGRLILSTHGTWLYHPHPTDFRRWTRDGLRRELEVRGFEIEEVQSLIGPLAWTTQFRSLAYHHVLSRLGVLGKGLAALVCSFMYLRMCLEDRLTPRHLSESNAAIYCITARLAS